MFLVIKMKNEDVIILISNMISVLRSTKLEYDVAFFTKNKVKN